MPTNISQTLGINFTREDSTQNYALGTIVNGTDGTMWQYVEFGSAVAQYEWVAIDENNLALVGTSALADVFHRIGIAQTTFTSAQYGWVVVNGTNVTATFDGTAAVDIQLYTSATAGNFSDITSGAEIEGITLVTAVSTQSQTAEVILNWPHRGWGGASN